MCTRSGDREIDTHRRTRPPLTTSILPFSPPTLPTYFQRWAARGRDLKDAASAGVLVFPELIARTQPTISSATSSFSLLLILLLSPLPLSHRGVPGEPAVPSGSTCWDRWAHKFTIYFFFEKIFFPLPLGEACLSASIIEVGHYGQESCKQVKSNCDWGRPRLDGVVCAETRLSESLWVAASGSISSSPTQGPTILRTTRAKHLCRVKSSSVHTLSDAVFAICQPFDTYSLHVEHFFNLLLKGENIRG